MSTWEFRGQHAVRWASVFFLTLAFMAVSSSAGDGMRPPFERSKQNQAGDGAFLGRRMQLTLRSGEEVIGIVKDKKRDSVELYTESGLRTVQTSDVTQAMFVKDAFDRALEEEQRATRVSAASQSGRVGYHRIHVASIGGGTGFSLDLSAYEYINRSRLGFKFSLLNVTGGYKRRTEPSRYSASILSDVETSSFAWVPFSIRMYFGQQASSVWPFIGSGIAYVSSVREHLLRENERSEGFRPIVETGIDFGGRMARGFLSVRYISAAYYPLTTVNLGFSIGWRSE